MTDEVYKPPESELLSESDTEANKFYVVTRVKLAVLFLATLGLYAFYWFYINWRSFRNATGQKLWPVPRAFFYIFFTHSLFDKVDAELKVKGLEYNWSPRVLATVFVILSILTNIIDRLSFKEIGSPMTDVLSLIMLPILMLFLMKAQGAINLSQGDIEGSSNSRFTVYNYLWILFGAVFWFFIAIGLLTIFGVISL